MNAKISRVLIIIVIVGYVLIFTQSFLYLRSRFFTTNPTPTPPPTPVVAKPYEPGEVYVQELNLFDGKLYRIYDVDADGTCWVTVSPTGASRSISCLRGNHGNNKAISE